MKLRPGLLAAALVLAAGLSACGHPAIESGSPAAPPAARLDALNAADARVAEVSWTLARSNADLCPVNRFRTGWSLQSASQYGDALRPVAEARYGLEGDLPGILAAPAGSPAAAAGLAPGDLILAVEGRPLDRGDVGAASAYDGLDANTALLDAAAAGGGPLDLSVRRAGVVRRVVVQPVAACAYPTQIELTGSFRSHTDGRHIFISDRMVEAAAGPDQLAFILAHELAHAVLEHRTQPDVTGPRGAGNAALTLRRGLSLSAEADADRLGLYLLARAGFDPYQAVAFLPRYAEINPAARFPQANAGGVYESAPARRRALQPVLADIAARRADGRPLIP
ncbi:M48 family metalloprotease [Brevundimonas sp. FT23028]|uniref:M48 family metalloprotease n=1 Tax=Brevundimonas sp. FT23028 TaxID=3393748 RepID=UPI003B58AA05